MTKNRWLFLGKLAVSAALLWLLLHVVDIELVIQHIREADISLFMLALLTVMFSYIISGLRWAWMAKGLGLEICPRRKIRLFFLGAFVSLFLPSTIGGDVLRGMLLAKGQGRKGIGIPAAASVFLDRANGLYAHILVVALCIPFVSVPPAWWLGWLAVLMVSTVGMILYPRIHPFLSGKLKILRILPLSSGTFYSFWNKCLIISVIIQILFIQAHYFLGLALGIQISWLEFAVLSGIVAMIAALPISLNGLGLRESGYVGFIAFFGGSNEGGAALAALWLLLLALASLPGLWFIWRGEGRQVLKTAGGIST